MKRNLIQFTTIAAMTAGLALAQQTPANPQPPANAPVHRPMAARRHQRARLALNLTEAQKQQAKTIFQETRKATEPVRAEMRRNREAMAEAVKADNTAQIQKLSKVRGELSGRLIAARSEARAKFYNILTPEQRTKLDQFHSAARQRFERRRAALRSNG